MTEKTRPIILTGDRPTGKLHLGHYVGSLKNRVKLQDEYDTFVIIADYQVLIDHLEDSRQVGANIMEVVLDYLSVGIDPTKSAIFIQSAVPQLPELTTYLSMLVTVARLRRNPTVKAEASKVDVDSERDDIVYGFLGYPVSQAAQDHGISTKTIYGWLARRTGADLSWGELNRLKRENRDLKELIGQLSLMMEKTKVLKKNQRS